MITLSQSADIALRSLIPEKPEELLQSIQQLEKFPQDSTALSLPIQNPTIRASAPLI